MNAKKQSHGKNFYPEVDQGADFGHQVSGSGLSEIVLSLSHKGCPMQPFDSHYLHCINTKINTHPAVLRTVLSPTKRALGVRGWQAVKHLCNLVARKAACSGQGGWTSPSRIVLCLGPEPTAKQTKSIGCEHWTSRESRASQCCSSSWGSSTHSQSLKLPAWGQSCQWGHLLYSLLAQAELGRLSFICHHLEVARDRDRFLFASQWDNCVPVNV